MGKVSKKYSRVKTSTFLPDIPTNMTILIHKGQYVAFEDLPTSSLNVFCEEASEAIINRLIYSDSTVIRDVFVPVDSVKSNIKIHKVE